jgi:hypothetical protein
MARSRPDKSPEGSTEKESLSARMRDLISKATVEERRQDEREPSGAAGERRRRDDETSSKHHDDDESGRPK